MALSDTSTIVVVPTFNERDNIATLVANVHSALPSAHILIIDDASPDGTGEIANTLAQQNPLVQVQHRAGKLGLGTAYRDAFITTVAQNYRFIVQMDADGSHRAEDVHSLLRAVQDNGGCAIGSRWIPGGSIHNWPRYRRFISRTGTRVAQLCLRSQLRDITSGFRAFDSQWLAKLNLERITSEGYSFQVEVAWRLEQLDCPITEVPIAFIERKAGRSKMSLRIVVEALLRVLLWGAKLRLNPEHRSRTRSALRP